MLMGRAINVHVGVLQAEEVLAQQRKVSITTEMVHAASLLHDDVIDHAETRRGKPSVNREWNIRKSTFAGVEVLAVSARVMARVNNEQVLRVIAQVAHDVVMGNIY